MGPTRRRTLLTGLAGLGAVAAWPRSATAQSARLPRVALVDSFKPAEAKGKDPIDPGVRAFVHGLRDQGLVAGKNITVERRSTLGRLNQLPAVMAEVRLGVDVLVTVGAPAVWAATRATDRIPIVGLVDYVLDMGILDSLARPGRNLTGFGENDAALHGKRLQMLKEVAPATSRIAVLSYRQAAHDRGGWRRDLEAAAQTLKLQTLWLDVDCCRSGPGVRQAGAPEWNRHLRDHHVRE